ncbi:MAG: patatin-like phospholipase family protein [Streptosporangiaceae bacterium]
MNGLRKSGGRLRRGLVLGAGGLVGGAWAAGALRAVEEIEGFDPRTAEVLVGTSAGAVMAAVLAAGVSTRTLVNHQRGVMAPGDPEIHWRYEQAAEGGLPPEPKLAIGSPALLWNSLKRLPRHALSVFYALLPEGRGSMEGIGVLVDAVDDALGRDRSWPDHPAFWVTALDYETGDRVVFGRRGAPKTTVRRAVMASCAIPAWFAPVRIGDHRYIDGGAYSATSLDLLAGHGLDEVYVVAPLVSFRFDRPRALMPWLERLWRRSVTRNVLREAEMLRREGTRVVIIGPGPEDLAAMGANLMDPGRRVKVLEISLRTSVEALANGRVKRVE